MNQLLSIMRKEFFHIRNDRQTLMVIFLFPIFMLILYGYAITLEMRNIPTAVADYSNTQLSRQFVEHLSASKFFLIGPKTVATRCSIVIPKDFTQDLVKHKQVKIQAVIDASDPNAANLIQNYLLMVVNQQFQSGVPAYTIAPRFLYNPDQRAANFFVPGLLALIIILISALLTSIAIVKEKETGTFEQILVSPVHAIHIIIGKVIPYVLIAFASGLIVLFAGIFLFKVPCVGSLSFLLTILFLYTLVGLSIGLLISTVVNTQQNAMLLALMATMLPNMMLSGFVFPLESMPKIFQYISYIVPARHFTIIIRGIMLKGSSLAEVYPQVLVLVGMAFFLLLVSIKKFKTRLE